MSISQRIKWNFQKAKVALMIGQLESLKMTLSLLVQILYAGKVIANSR